MLVPSFVIFSFAFIGVTNGAMTVDGLARCIMSEASIGNTAEQTAIGFACQRNRNHASNQQPTATVTQLARDILAGRITDPTQGANYWYSPRAMPKETQRSLCSAPVGSGNMDCRGGLESVCSGGKNYKPSWSATYQQIIISGVRDCYYKFYKN